MKLIESNVKDVLPLYKQYYTSLDGGFDSFYEDQLLQDNVYLIQEEKTIYGCCTISKDNRLSGLYVKKEFQHLYESIFYFVIHAHNVVSLMGITNDTLLLNQLLKRNDTIRIQAVNFIYRIFPTNDFTMKEANMDDLEIIEDTFGDFFDDYDRRIQNNELYLGYDKDEIVSLGDVEYSKLLDNVVSVGMIVKEDARNQGYGRKTIQALSKMFMTDGYRVQAGCWYYNHPSKKALIGAKMSEANFIIVVEAL